MKPAEDWEIPIFHTIVLCWKKATETSKSRRNRFLIFVTGDKGLGNRKRLTTLKPKQQRSFHYLFFVDCFFLVSFAEFFRVS
jgi:hypothetical protein